MGALVLARPLMTWIGVLSSGYTTERDFLYQVPSLPRVYDGAYLALIYYASAVTAAYNKWMGHLNFCWG